MSNKIRFMTIAILMVIASVLLFKQPPVVPEPAPATPASAGAAMTFTPVLSDSAKEHILHGDGTSGGHLHGTGTPCKSEFPADWNEDKITTTVIDLADNEHIKWRQEDNGYYVSEQDVNDLRVRVVINESGTEIVTAYPTNVARNPCAAP